MATEYPFRWKTRQVRNPYMPSHPYARLTRYTLICNACNEEVTAGRPGNGNGFRYFVYRAGQIATAHLSECGKGNA